MLIHLASRRQYASLKASPLHKRWHLVHNKMCMVLLEWLAKTSFLL